MAAPLRVRSTAPGQPTPPPSGPDTYLARLVKLVPAEVLALYMTFKAPMEKEAQLALWGLICLGLVLVVRTAATYQKGARVQVAAVVVAAVSFVLWVYGMGYEIAWLAPFLTWLRPPFNSIAIAVWTFLVPYLYKGD
jgi:hypothetical protein